MKKILLQVVAFLFCIIPGSHAQVGIGTTNPNSTAILDLTSTTKGFLPPRLTIAQRDSIVNPPAGLMVFCTNCAATGIITVYNGYNWTDLSGGNPGAGSFVKICNQVWTTKNLDVANYRNGDPIPLVTDPTEWSLLSTGAYCYYNNDSATYAAIYGKLYNWYAVNDPRGLAPPGWHIPTSAECITLIQCLDGEPVAGGRMKEPGTTHWASPNTAASNSSGFTGLPGGLRDHAGVFSGITHSGNWWSSTQYGIMLGLGIYVYHDNGGAYNGGNDQKRNGYSIRCVRD